MLKSTLRKQSLQQRIAINEDDFLVLNQLLLAQFKTLDFDGVNVVHVFLPIVEKREPDTFLLINWLQENHPQIHIVVPKANFIDHTMTNHLYKRDDLQVNAYQIPEPQTTEPFDGKVDLVLVPLLAFDLRGYRVGYGKGFYDRFLAQTNATAVGIAMFDPVDEITDIHEDDIKLNLCITPKQIYRW